MHFGVQERILNSIERNCFLVVPLMIEEEEILGSSARRLDSENDYVLDRISIFCSL